VGPRAGRRRRLRRRPRPGRPARAGPGGERRRGRQPPLRVGRRPAAPPHHHLGRLRLPGRRRRDRHRPGHGQLHRRRRGQR
jgi:hypothetical protein